MKISVVINTFNSERFLDACLKSVATFDEIVLCDMHSTDQTCAIAEKYGCRIVYHERTGFVEPARNYAIAQASNEWVLVLDSDEVVPVPYANTCTGLPTIRTHGICRAENAPQKLFLWKVHAR